LGLQLLALRLKFFRLHEERLLLGEEEGSHGLRVQCIEIRQGGT
jgi:hypothetical protein